MKQETPTEGLPSTQASSGFAWSNCADRDLRTRVSLKQQAVDDAFGHARQLCAQLREELAHINPGHAVAFDLMGGNEIRAWVEEMEGLEAQNKGLEILVGVAGATGAGKTSLLNALLEYPELLPSSSTEAATATVCRIAWNYDDAEGHEFRAEVRFRSKKAVSKELDDVLTAVKDRKDVRGEEFEDEDERIKAIEELTDIISSGINKICAVWGVDESEIEDSDYTKESMMASNKEIVNLLDKTIIIHSSDADEFASEVKPYLDSTPTPDGITAWPLIEEVRIYLKSDILKHGIVLVDLPGLCDMVEDRSAVAEGYYQNLSVTTIVTPAIRAVDEKTGVKLVGNHQELRMQLDGKFHKDSFCVVVSKIDDMDCDAFCKSNKEARQDEQLLAQTAKVKFISRGYIDAHKELRNAERKFDAFTRKCTALKDKIDTSKGDDKKGKRVTKLRNKRTALMKDRYKQLAVMNRLSAEAAQLDRSLASFESGRKHRYVLIRNHYIKKRIQTDFARRQKKLIRLAEHNSQTYDGSIEVFPVCAAAFGILLKGKKPMPGFPSKLYTGISRLHQWLGEAVFGYREEHLDSVLRGLQCLYDGIRCWSNDDTRGMVHFSRAEVQSLLQSSHDKYSGKIGEVLTHSASGIKHLSPLREKDERLSSCGSLAIQAASRWAYKFPDDVNSTQKMSWVTYQAILKKNGGPFQSSGIRRPFYDFPLALATPFLETLREDWLSFFQVELPSAGEPLVAEAAEIWEQYMDEIRMHIQETAPDIIPYFDATAKTLENIKTDLIEQISSAIKSLSDGSSRIHPLFVTSLRRGLAPHFSEALKLTGKKHFTLRQSYLRNALADEAPALFRTGYQRMEAAYTRRAAALPPAFQALAKAAVAHARTHIGLLLNNLQAYVGAGRDRTALERKVTLQRWMKKGALEWGACWRFPSSSFPTSREGVGGSGMGQGEEGGDCLEIPEVYVEAEVEEGKVKTEAEYGEEESESNSDTEDEMSE